MSKVFMRVLSLALVLVMALSLSGLAYADGEALDILAAVEEAVEETPVEEVPVEEETPVVEEAPVEEETPVEEEIPAEEETPVEEEIPAEEETPVEDETPALDVILPEDIITEVEEVVAEVEEEAETLLAEDANFGIGSATYADLGAAIAAAKSGDTIVVLKDTTVTGSHTIPSGVTLLVPFDAANTCYTTKPGSDGGAGYVLPTAYRTLTLADGASVTVNGAISVSAKHHAGAACSGSASSNAGSPTGSVGFVIMGSGSSITVNNGGKLYAWGFIVGSGSVTAKSGATVYENFQVLDFGGGSLTVNMSVSFFGIGDPQGVFPLSQFYVQNIEVPLTFESGASEKVYTSVYMDGSAQSMDLTFIGSGGLFVLDSGSYLVKSYDGVRDRMVFDVYGSGSIEAIKLQVKYIISLEVSSADFVLPIHSGFVINVNSGTTTVGQHIVLHAGSEIVIKEGASVKLESGSGMDDYFAKGNNLVLFDADEWNATNFVNFGRKYATVPYAYSRTGSRTIEDAKLVVDGTLTLDGYLYTTNGGASITGTGKILLNKGAGTDKTIRMSSAVGSSPNYQNIAIKSPFEGGAGSVYAYNPATGTWGKQVPFTADLNKDGATDSGDLVSLMKLIVGTESAENLDMSVIGNQQPDILTVIAFAKYLAAGYVFEAGAVVQ